MSSYIYIMIFAIMGVLILLVLFMLIQKSKKGNKTPLMNTVLIDQVIAFLGGQDNLIRAFQEGGRTKITVTDSLVCNFQKLKELGVTNIFISGNTVKMMCPFDTSTLVDSINQR